MEERGRETVVGGVKKASQLGRAAASVCHATKICTQTSPPTHHQGLVLVVVLCSEALDLPRDGVRQPVAEVNTGIAKPDSCHCTGQVHGSPGLSVFIVINSSVGGRHVSIVACTRTYVCMYVCETHIYSTYVPTICTYVCEISTIVPVYVTHTHSAVSTESLTALWVLGGKYSTRDTV